MAISIKNEAVSDLVVKLAIKDAVRLAVEEKLARIQAQSARQGVAENSWRLGPSAPSMLLGGG